ncbi:YdiY family protein [Marinobacter sp.]|uniref:DUF481 domain-containing protein n=1 Tax=Marinobacter sp. TaxID=50741 RepID=UPI00384DF935
MQRVLSEKFSRATRVTPLITCATALLFVIHAPGLQADRVFLSDGSLVNGKVISLYEDEVLVDTSFAGEMEIEADQIAGVTTDDPVVTQLADGNELVGSLSWDEELGQQISSDLLGTVQIPFSSISSIWHEQLTERHEETLSELEGIRVTQENVWSGRLNLGLAGADGNTDRTSFNGRVSTARETDFDRLTFSLRNRFAEEDGEETENQTVANARLERDISERFFVFGNLGLERDRFENLDLRAALTAGLGYFVIQRDDHKFKPRVGVGYQVEAFDSKDNESEPLLALGYDYLIQFYGDTEFTHEFTWLPSLEDPGSDYRLVSEAALIHPLDEASTWNLGVRLTHEFDANPSADVEKLDTFYSLELVRTFN